MGETYDEEAYNDGKDAGFQEGHDEAKEEAAEHIRGLNARIAELEAELKGSYYGMLVKPALYALLKDGRPDRPGQQMVSRVAKKIEALEAALGELVEAVILRDEIIDLHEYFEEDGSDYTRAHDIRIEALEDALFCLYKQSIAAATHAESLPKGGQDD